MRWLVVVVWIVCFRGVEMEGVRLRTGGGRRGITVCSGGNGKASEMEL